MTHLSKPMTTAQAHREIRRMYRQKQRDEKLAALWIRAYSLLIFAINNSKKL